MVRNVARIGPHRVKRGHPRVRSGRSIIICHGIDVMGRIRVWWIHPRVWIHSPSVWERLRAPPLIRAASTMIRILTFRFSMRYNDIERTSSERRPSCSETPFLYDRTQQAVRPFSNAEIDENKKEQKRESQCLLHVPLQIATSWKMPIWLKHKRQLSCKSKYLYSCIYVHIAD